jgi:hypothetical protein
VGLWTRVLRLICLSAARSLWQFDSSEVTRRTNLASPNFSPAKPAFRSAIAVRIYA